MVLDLLRGRGYVTSRI